MAGFVAMQPNGRYCRFSTIVDCPTHINMTEEVYLNNVTGTVPNREYGLDVLENYLRPFSEVLESFTTNNMSQEKFNDYVATMCSEPDGRLYELT